MRTAFSILALMTIGTLTEDAHGGWYTDSLKNAPIIEIRGESADTSTARAAGDKYVQDNLDYVLANNEWVVVNFCAYWCGDCNNFKPDFTKAAKRKEYKAIRWAVADVDGIRGNENFRKRFGLPGTPSVLLFHRGEIVKDAEGRQTIMDGHKGDKSYRDLNEYLKSHFKQ